MAPHYFSERQVVPVAIDEIPRNRRQRRLAAKSLQTGLLNEEPATSLYANFIEDKAAAASKDVAAREELPPSEWDKLGNKSLPIAEYEYDIRCSVRDNQFTIVKGMTGSGKSTQVPQMIAKDGRSSKMMQPRRLAADMITDRISSEIATTYPDSERDIVGCTTADKNTITLNTMISIVTDGVMLKQLPRDFSMAEQPVYIPDEVHEFKVETEVMLAMLKREAPKNPDLRAVLMSGSMNAEALRDYFASAASTPPPIIEIPVMTYEVEDIPAPESTVADQAFQYGRQGKNVLCFVEGKREIADTIDEIKKKFREAGGVSPRVLPLHAKLSQSARDAALADYPNGKIIVSTDVAETSITIDADVVVDCGRKKEPHLDEEFAQSLDTVLAARSNLIQRRGRCGRYKDGIYVLTRPSEDDEFVSFDDETRPDYPIPEIQRTEVDRTVLYVASIGVDIAELDFYHPIDPLAIQRAQQSLRTLCALDDDNKITPAGRRMEALPMSPSLARMVIESERYSANTRAQITAIAAAVECGGMQNFGKGIGKKWNELVNQNESDMIAQLELFLAAQDMSTNRLVEYNLEPLNVDRAKILYRKAMKRIGLPVESLIAPNDIELENLRRCILSGMVDYVYEHAGNGEYMRVGGQHMTPREVSNRSVVKGNAPMVVGHPYRYDVYANGDIVSKHILEKVTKVRTPAILGEIAASMCTWETGEYQLRGGHVMQRQNQQFQSMALGVTREAEAEVDQKSVEYLAGHIMENPGKALRELFAIESDIKILRNLSPNAPDSIHDMILDLVRWAAEASNLNESYADNLLRERMAAEDIRYERIIKPEDQAEIYQNAPRFISAEGLDFVVDYEKGAPLVKRQDLEKVAGLSEEVFLADGRMVLFIGPRGRKYTIADLHAGKHLS